MQDTYKDKEIYTEITLERQKHRQSNAFATTHIQEIKTYKLLLWRLGSYI